MNRYSRVHAEIDLDAILHNMDAMRGNIAKDTKLWRSSRLTAMDMVP